MFTVTLKGDTAIGETAFMKDDCDDTDQIPAPKAPTPSITDNLHNIHKDGVNGIYNVVLKQGETYVGICFSEDGKEAHHLVLVDIIEDGSVHSEAMKLAKSAGGNLPSKIEARLLLANPVTMELLNTEDWFWCEENYDGIASTNDGEEFPNFRFTDEYFNAIVTDFDDGVSELGTIVVRRIPIQINVKS